MANEVVRFTTGPEANLASTSKVAGTVRFAVDSNNKGSIYFDKDNSTRIKMSGGLDSLTINGNVVGSVDLTNTRAGVVTVKKNTFVTGTGTSNGVWKGELAAGTGITALYDGFTIDYWINIAGVSSGTTLNLTLSDGATTGALPVYYQGTTRLTTHYAVNNIVRLTYREVTIGTTNYQGWWCYGNYDTNDFYRLRYQNVIKAEKAITSGNVIVGTSAGYKHLKDGTVFDINYPILWAGSNIAVSGTNNNTYLFYPFTVTTTQSLTLTAYKPVYIKGHLNGTQFTPISTTPLTQTEPTSEDGYDYINLGMAYSTTAMYLLPEHKIFRYINNKFQELTQCAIAAVTDSHGQNIRSTYIKNVSLSGNTITVTKGDDGTSSFDIAITDENVISEQANTTKAYVTGTTQTNGTTPTHLKYDSNIYLDTTAGQLVATKFKGALIGNADTATKATQDSKGQNIASTYISGLTFSGNDTKDADGTTTITAGSKAFANITKGDGGTSKTPLPIHGNGVAGVITSGAQTIYGVKTFNNVVKLLANQYTDNAATASLDLQNSDIRGVNSIKFADLSDSAAEGFQWYRDSTHVDSLWVKNGEIYFTPNREWGTNGTSYAVITSGNYRNYFVLPYLNSTTDRMTFDSIIYAPSTGGTAGQYLKSAGDAKPVWQTPVDKTSNSALANTDTALVTGRGVYYSLAQINNGDQSHGVSIYAPTTGGTANYWLVANSATTAPSWKDPSTLTVGKATGDSAGTNIRNNYLIDVTTDTANHKLTIKTGAGGTTDRALNFVKLAGDTMTGALTPVGKEHFIAYPSDGEYSYGGSAITGYIKIKIPKTKSATMFTFDVDIYNYVTDTSVRYHIGGYNYSDASWINTTAYCIAPLANAKADLKVRFLSDGGDNMYVTIGETDTAWSYPKVYVHNITIGHSGNSYTNWASGWIVTLENTAISDSLIKRTIEHPNINDRTLQDSAGQQINSTYIKDITVSEANHKLTFTKGNGGTTDRTLNFVKLAGDTMSGDLTVNKSSGATFVNVKNGSGEVGIHVNSNRGLYDNTKSSWFIYRAPSGTVTYLLSPSGAKTWSFDDSGNLTTPSGATNTANLIGTATRAVNDSLGQIITGYYRDVSISGKTLTMTTGAGGTKTATIGLSGMTELLKPISTTTTASASTWNIPSGSYQVWGERFSDTRLKYTPSGGSETTVTDTGDWTMWLTPSATSNLATLNMRIDGDWYATTFRGAFVGNVTGNASTADTWKTARTFTVKDYDKGHSGAGASVNGSANVELIMPDAINAKQFIAVAGLTGDTTTAIKSSGDIIFTDSGTNTRQIRMTVGANDFFRIAGGATVSNSGWGEIATADDGTEPIYVRQYTGTYTTIKRTLTLLDASGHTTLPGDLKVTTTNTQNLGASGVRWKALFIGTADSYGGNARHIYWSNGVPVQSTATIGSTTVPMWLDGGTMKEITSYSGNAATTTQFKTARYISLGGFKTYNNSNMGDGVVKKLYDGTSDAAWKWYELGALGGWDKEISTGKLVNKDIFFENGNNNVSLYNNTANGTTTVTRITKPTDCPSQSGYVIEIKHTGTTSSPGYGGFYQSISSRANAHFIIKYIMKIPVGYKVNTASNSMGTNYSDGWLTDTEGTGNWAVYIREVKCGSTGSFSNGGHVYLTSNGNGAAPTSDAPVIWYLAAIWQMDVTGREYIARSQTYTVGSATKAVYFKQGEITAADRDFLEVYNGGAINVNTIKNASMVMVQNGSNAPHTYGQILTLPYRKPYGNTTADYLSQIFLPTGDAGSSYGNSMWFRTSKNADNYDDWQSVAHHTSKTAVGSSTKPVYIEATGNIVAISSYEGNAATASAFNSNRTITLNNDTTGSATGNGSAGWSINTTTKLHTYQGRWTTAAAMNLNPSVTYGCSKMSIAIMDSTSRSNSATDAPSFDCAVMNFPWDQGGYNGQIAIQNTVKDNTRMQIRSSTSVDNGADANPRYTSSYGAWREVVTADKATQMGSATQPVYVTNTGQIKAINQTISNGTANRIAFYSGANTISAASTSYASNTALGVNVTSVPTNYNFRVSGASYLDNITVTNHVGIGGDYDSTTTANGGYLLKVYGKSWVQGPLLVGNADTAANSGYATANVGLTNYIAFYGVYGDNPGSFNHTYIGERIYGSKTTANEQSELLLFHGNDAGTGSGPDRIRLFSGNIDFQVFTSATSGTWQAVGESANAIQVLNLQSGVGTLTGNWMPEANLTRNIGSADVRWNQIHVGSLQLDRNKSSAQGRIYWYSPTYYTWVDYMSNCVDSGSPTGGRPAELGDVTSWAKRSIIENGTGYGWVWEAAGNAAAASAGTMPTARMALNSNNGHFWLAPDASSTTCKTGGLIIDSSKNAGSGNVAIELWRGTNASWQIANESGTLYIRNNYTTAVQTTYSQTAMSIAYNTGITTLMGTIDSTTTATGTLIIKGGVGVAKQLTAGRLAVSTNKMVVSAGKVYSNISGSNVIQPGGTTSLYSDGIAITNPTTPNDVAWMRVLGTGETDTLLEIATGDDGGSGETIHIRSYNTSNTIVKDITLLDTEGNSTFPNTIYVKPTLGSYRQGIRIYPTGNYSGVMLMGSDHGNATSGTTANSWGIWNKDGQFGISRNGDGIDTKGTYYFSHNGTNWSLKGHFVPDANNTYTIGTKDLSWKNIFGQTVHGNILRSINSDMPIRLCADYLVTTSTPKVGTTTNLTTSDSDDEWLKALLKAICATYPNESGLFRGKLSPNSILYYEIYIYNSGTVDSTTGLPQYSFGTYSHWSKSHGTFGTSSYTFFREDIVRADGGTWNINAATSTKFNSARTIALTGDTTGSTSSDGNSGWSIATTTTLASRPRGFSSDSQSSASWGNSTGTGITTWNDSSGGSIEFRKDNPSSGKLSIKIDGRFYGAEGNKPAMLMTNANNYWGMGDPDGVDTAWIRTTNQGLLPYQSGGRSGGHQSLGTSSWYFANAYIDNIFSSKLEFLGGRLERVKLLPQTTGAFAAGWKRVCKIQSYYNYGNFQIMLTGGWSSGAPTVANISVALRNGQATIKALDIGFTGNIQKIRLVKLDDQTNIYWLDVYIPAWNDGAVLADQWGTFIGNVTISEVNTTLTNAPDATAAAEVDLTVMGTGGMNNGTANRMAYYSTASKISSASNVSVLNNYLISNSRNGATVDIRANGIRIWGQTYGNTANQMLSNTIGNFRFGDGGPQIQFNTTDTMSAQAGAIIFTDHDNAGAGASFQFVTTENAANGYGGDLWLCAPIIKARNQFRREGRGSTWIVSRDHAVLRETTSAGWHAILSFKTASGSWQLGEYNSSGWQNRFQLCYTTDTDYNAGTNSGMTSIYGTADGYWYAARVYNAVWNDYAEHRKTVKDVQLGQVVAENGNGEQHITKYRLEVGANITSDTYGTSMNETPESKTPIAVAGRVLAYVDGDRNNYKPGDAVCSGPNGTVSKMTRREIRRYPDAIIGYVSEIPDYEIWHAGDPENGVATDIKVNGRIWIKVN